MGDIHYIVDKLNAPPFQYNLTLLSFSEKTSLELLQLLSDIFSRINPKHQKVDVSKEDLDTTVDRLVNFLKIVKYKINYDPVSFRQLLASGEKDVIYPILKWVVPQPQALEKRAYVGHYLSFPDMPEDLNYDPEVAELREEIKAMHPDFIDTHKASEAVKALDKDAQALRARIKGLEEEKERLVDKVERAKAGVDRLADKAAYLEVCTALRKLQDEEVELSKQLQTQRALLEKADALHAKVAARLRDMSATAQEGGSAGKLLELLTEDVQGLRFQVNEKYPKELEKRQRRAAALQEAFTNGVNTESDLKDLQSKADSLNQQITAITQRQAAKDKETAGQKGFLQLRQAQQMAGMSNKRKEDIAAKLERLQEKKVALTAQVEKLTASEGTGIEMVSNEQWRAKYEAMKAALPQYKRMKKELGDLEAEGFVLAYTEEQLLNQEAGLTGQVRNMERQQGVTGFADVVNGIEKVSEAKSAIDEAKGNTLVEISRTVEDINAAISERKTRLAPQIKKLRQVRQAYSELEAEHNQKKSTYDAAMSQYDARVAALETEVTGLKTEAMEAEQKYHLLNCQVACVDHTIRRITSGPPAERLRERLTMRVNEAEELTKELKDKQRDLKDKHSDGLSQIDMMNDLVRLLQVKADCQRKELGFTLPKNRDINNGMSNAPGSLKLPTNRMAATPLGFNNAAANVMVL